MEREIMAEVGYVQDIFFLPKERKAFHKNIWIKRYIKLFAGMVKN